MPTRCATRRGAVHKGSIEGQSEQLVVAKLRELGLRARVGHQPGASRSSAPTSQSAAAKARSDCDSIVVFSRQLATMVGAGLTLIRALGDPRRSDRVESRSPR